MVRRNNEIKKNEVEVGIYIERRGCNDWGKVQLLGLPLQHNDQLQSMNGFILQCIKVRLVSRATFLLSSSIVKEAKMKTSQFECCFSKHLWKIQWILETISYKFVLLTTFLQKQSWQTRRFILKLTIGASTGVHTMLDRHAIHRVHETVASICGVFSLWINVCEIHAGCR